MSGGDRVLWSEGLFLRPQHFQQQDRHTEALVRGALQAGAAAGLGLPQRSTLDAALLEAGRVAVTAARGIFPDGTPFAIPETMDPPEPVAIARDTPAGAVLLALPLETPGGASFDPAHAAPSGARYRGRIERVRDAVHGGGEPEEIEIARPVALLLAPGRDAGGYTTLPVAEPDRPARRRRRGAAPRTSCRRRSPPRRCPFYGQLLQEVVTGLDRIAEAHGRMVLGGAGRSVENLLVLELANTARPRLAHMLAQDALPPGRALPRARRPRRADGDLRLGLAPADRAAGLRPPGARRRPSRR